MLPAGQIPLEGPRDWIGYWDQDRYWAGSELWKVNAKLFFRRFEPLVGLRETDTVANIGCGLGYLETMLAPRVKAIHAFDTSRRFVQSCRENCRPYPNVRVSLLEKEYADLRSFGERFSLFLCVSVVQYYPHPEKVETLIHSAQAVALPGARMLIADLPQPKGLLGQAWDAGSSLLLSLREGYLPDLLRTVWPTGRARAAYQAFRRRAGELRFPNRELEGLIRRMKLDATIIRRSLSVCANRPSLLIRF